MGLYLQRKHSLNKADGANFYKGNPSPDESFKFQRILALWGLQMKKQLIFWLGGDITSVRKVRTPCVTNLLPSMTFTRTGVIWDVLFFRATLPPMPPVLTICVLHQQRQNLEEFKILIENLFSQSFTSNCLFSAASLKGVFPNLSLFITAPCLRSHWTWNIWWRSWHLSSESGKHPNSCDTLLVKLL